MRAETIVVPADAKFASGIVIRPGDKLVLGYEKRLSVQEADAIIGHFAAKLPGVEIVLVDQIAHMAVYRPDDRPVRKVGYALTDDEYEAMQAQGIVDADGKTTMDRIMEQLPNEIHK